jgi:hypothetical protein
MSPLAKDVTMPKTLDERLDQAIASRFTTSLMSNAKWRKAFRILSDPALGLKAFRCKNVPLLSEDEDYVHWYDRLPPPHMIGEKAIGDCLAGGPLYYRAIEWIEIPAENVDRSPERPVVQQDIVAAAHALSQAGQFPLELTDAWLRLYGYR